MPRPKANRCLLIDLLSALIGSPQGDHLVCEFTCSCCRSNVAAAADALCSFLGDGAEALIGFTSRNGDAAVQVGLASSNDAVVCASVRVLGAVLQAMVRHSAANTAATAHRSQQQSFAGPVQHGAAATACVLQPTQSHHQEQQQQQQGAGSALQACVGSTTDVMFLDCGVRTAVASASCDSSWQEQLQLLLDLAGSLHGRTVAIQAAALQELRQLLLLLAETLQTPSNAAAASASAQQHNPVGTHDDVSSMSFDAAAPCTRQHMQQLAAAVSHASAAHTSFQLISDTLLARDVMALSLAALQNEHQDIRRAGSQVLAAAVVLHQQR